MMKKYLIAGFLTGAFLAVFSIRAGQAAEGRIPISGCTSIDASGSYLLTRDIPQAETVCPCIDIKANNVTLDMGGHLLEMPQSLGGCAAIYAVDKKSLHIRNGIIANASDGIYLVNLNTPGDFVIEKMTIVGSGQDGIHLEGDASCTASGAGNTCSRALLRDNVIKAGTQISSNGIFMQGYEGSILENNTIHLTDTGIQLQNSRNNILRKNTISKCFTDGVVLASSSSSNHIVMNVISNNTNGISILGGTTDTTMSNVVEKNIISFNDIGVNIFESHNNTVSHNNITNNTDTGILVQSNSSGNSIDWNNLTGNANFGMHFDSTTHNNVFSNNRSWPSGIIDDTCNVLCLNDDGGGNIPPPG